MADRHLDRFVEVPLAGGMVRGNGCDLVLVEWTDPGGGHDPPRYIAPLHAHHEDDEAWYVLEGTLAFRFGRRLVHVPAGGAALAPRGLAHTFWNPHPQPARYVLVMTPRIERLIAAVHALERPDDATLAATFAAHASEYFGWP